MARRLAAILAADVVGYSRLMGADEAATLEALKAHRKELIDPKVAEHDGRVVKLMGDGALVEFASVIDAVRCAVEIQHRMAERNASVAEARRIEFRIGINLGDVVIEGDDIYGEGVNIAARLEGLAEPGGVCISEDVYRQVRSKLRFDFEDLGEHEVKNIAQPVRAYRVLSKPTPGRDPSQPTTRKGPWVAASLAAAAAVLIVVAGATLWLRAWAPSEEPAPVERMALPLPDKPSIAVLPFANISDDPSQEYFADGLTEDLITDLSKISGLFVISRNSTFTYKGQPVKVRQVAEDLGVRYVLEGSVRRAGDQIRVNAQLIDATTGGHLWAERYDGALDEVFALQDKVTRQIVTALAVNLTAREQVERAAAKTGNPEAYDAYLRGWAHYRRNTPDDYTKAREHYERAIELDPNYSQALAALAAVYWESYYKDWSTAMKMARVSARDHAKKYLERALTNPTPLALQVSSKMLLWWGKYEAAIAEARRAIALNPSDADSHVTLAETLIWSGSSREALDLVESARRLDPHNEAYHAYVEGLAAFALDQFETAAVLFERALDMNPEFDLPRAPLAATYAHLDRVDDARATIGPYCARGRSVGSWIGYCRSASAEAHHFPYKTEKDRQRVIQGLVRAGLPE